MMSITSTTALDHRDNDDRHWQLYKLGQVGLHWWSPPSTYMQSLYQWPAAGAVLPDARLASSHERTAADMVVPPMVMPANSASLCRRQIAEIRNQIKHALGTMANKRSSGRMHKTADAACTMVSGHADAGSLEIGFRWRAEGRATP